jgi:dihydrofolate reductase
MPSISTIVARSYPGDVIGYKNKLPWQMKSDLKRFREITTGHVVIMGRTTFLSIGRALPNRTNIVLTRDTSLINDNSLSFEDETQLCWSNTPEDALLIADIISICRQKKDIFVIGGNYMFDIYEKFVDKVFLTEVFAEVIGDAYFVKKFPTDEWKTKEEKEYQKNDTGDQYNSRFSIYEKRNKTTREEFISRFFTEQVEKKQWLSMQVKKNISKIISYERENPVLDI